MRIHKARIGAFTAEWLFDDAEPRLEVIWEPDTPTKADFIADPTFWSRYTKERRKANRRLEKITGLRVLTVDMDGSGKFSVDDGELLRHGIHPSDGEAD